MEISLVLNGYEIKATVDEQEKLIMDLVARGINLEEFTNWLKIPCDSNNKRLRAGWQICFAGKKVVHKFISFSVVTITISPWPFAIILLF